MTRRVPTLTAAIAAALVAAGAAGWDAAPLREALAARHEALASIRSVALRAEASVVTRSGGVERRGQGVVEYAAEGPRYRVRCSSDRALGLADDHEIAFDGARLYLLNRTTRLLSVRTGDSRQLPLALPNPFFLAFDYLRAGGDECPQCETTLADVAGPAAADRLRRGLFVDPAASTELSLPGPPFEGQPTVFRIAVADPSAPRVTRIRREIGTLGEVTTELSGHAVAPGLVLELPRRIRTTTRLSTATGEIAAQIEFVVTELAFDEPAMPGAFTIDDSRADTVWDDDARVFVKGAAQP